MGVCSARGDGEHGALGVGDPPSLPFLRFPQRTRGSEREELGVIVEGGKPFPEGRSPNRKWRQWREGRREGGSQAWSGFQTVRSEQPCLGLKLPYFRGEYLYVFHPGLWTSPLSTCQAYSRFSAPNSQ